MPIERSTHPFDLAMAFRSEINQTVWKVALSRISALHVMQ